MRTVGQYTLLLLRTFLLLLAFCVPVLAQGTPEPQTAEETEAIRDIKDLKEIQKLQELSQSQELDEQEKAQLEAGMTAEQLSQPIPIEHLVLLESVRAGADAETLSDYTLGFQDVIQINVLRHPEVSGEYIINAEGNVQYEFVGDINVLGLKKDEVKDLLIEKLSHYIIKPEVTVKITGYYSKILYVVGEVGHPGKIFMKGDTMTVREALVQAGLPLLSGKLKDARLITPDDTGKAAMKKVNVHNLLYQGDLRENLVMNPGDTLYIPPTFLAKTMRIIQPIAAPITTAGGAARNVYAPGF